MVYFAISILFAYFVYRGLRRFDVEKYSKDVPPDLMMDTSVGFDEKLDHDFKHSLSVMLRGSLTLSIFFILLWVIIPLNLAIISSLPFYASIIFALPGGWALAVGVYNMCKVLKSKKDNR